MGMSRSSLMTRLSMLPTTRGGVTCHSPRLAVMSCVFSTTGLPVSPLLSVHITAQRTCHAWKESETSHGVHRLGMTWNSDQQAHPWDIFHTISFSGYFIQ
jgi:hypothetical protein